MNTQSPSRANANFASRLKTSLVITSVALVAAVLIGAFRLSYDALLDLAIQAGMKPNLAPIWPILLDGSLVIYSVALFLAKIYQEPFRKKAFSLVIGFGWLSLFFNAMHSPIPAPWLEAIPAWVVPLMVWCLPPLLVIVNTEMIGQICECVLKGTSTLQQYEDRQAARQVKTQATVSPAQAKKLNLARLRDLWDEGIKQTEALAELLDVSATTIKNYKRELGLIDVTDKLDREMVES